MHKVKAERWRAACQEHAYFAASLDLEIADWLREKILQEISRNFRKDWNKFPEIFRGKFPEISELTTLPILFCGPSPPPPPLGMLLAPILEKDRHLMCAALGPPQSKPKRHLNRFRQSSAHVLV